MRIPTKLVLETKKSLHRKPEKFGQTIHFGAFKESLNFCQLVIERKRFPWVSHWLWLFFTVAECYGPEKEDICYITYPFPKKRNKQQVMSLGPGGMTSIYRTLLQDISKFSLSTRTPLWRFVGFSRDPYCMDSLGCCIRYGGMGAKNLSLARMTWNPPPSKLAGKFSAWWLLRFSIRKKSQKLKKSTIEISFWQKLRLVIYNVFHVPWMKKNQTLKQRDVQQKILFLATGLFGQWLPEFFVPSQAAKILFCWVTNRG